MSQQDARKKHTRTEIIVGSFVLAGLVVIVLGIFTIRGLGWKRLDAYHARYRNAGGIEVGTPVKFNGVMRGRIKEIVIDDVDPTLVRVNFVVRQGTPVTTRTIAKITRADILGDPYIDLRFAETTPGTAASLASAGEALPPGSEVAAGDAFDLQTTLDHAQDAIASLSALAELLKDQLQSVVSSTQHLLDAAQDLLSPENRETISSALAHVQDSMRRIDTMLAENRERIDGIVNNADRTTAQMNELSIKLTDAVDEVLPKATALLDETRASLGDVRQVLSTADGAMRGLDMKQVGDVIENLDTASRNLSDLSRELKDRPYKLIRSEKPEPPRFPAGTGEPSKK